MLGYEFGSNLSKGNWRTRKIVCVGGFACYSY